MGVYTAFGKAIGHTCAPTQCVLFFIVNQTLKGFHSPAVPLCILYVDLMRPASESSKKR